MATETTPGSGQWIAVGMMPIHTVIEFQWILLDGKRNLVKWECKGVNRKITINDSNLCISLPWGKPDVHSFLPKPPQNYGKLLIYYLTYHVNYFE